MQVKNNDLICKRKKHQTGILSILLNLNGVDLQMCKYCKGHMSSGEKFPKEKYYS